MRAGNCKHFKGVQHETCAAGVLMRLVRDESGPAGKGYRWPCLTIAGQSPCVTVCAKKEPMTQAEVDAEYQAFEADAAKMLKARAAIVVSKKKAGPIDCPVCAMPQALAFSQSSFNGHIHAVCSTPGCVKWME